jgi:hypothetical protein
MSDDNLIVIVKDTGCGLDPAFVPDMWIPFKQGEVRGSARGTGLGLSIIKRLLHRMKGDINVTSDYMHSEGVGPNHSGSTFTVTIPMQSTQARAETFSNEEPPRIAILSRNQSRSIDGFRTCWETYGFEVELVHNVASLTQSKWKYVWAELDFLQREPSQFNELLRCKKSLVLVPYDTHDSLEGLPGILAAPNFVMLPKPLIWHTFERRIMASKHRRQSAAPFQALRFAAEVEVMNREVNHGEQQGQVRRPPQQQEPEVHPKANHVILVVEDNSVRYVRSDTVYIMKAN